MVASPVDSLGYSALITYYLDQWGLSSLSSLVDDLGKTGASPDEITIRIQQSPQYKARFAGNDARVKKGLAPLDPATYIALEGQYKQILSQLPKGFYDSKVSIDNFIGGDVSPSELSDRVKLANDAYVTASPEARTAWDTYYGHAGAGGAVAAILDTSVAEPLLQQRAQAAGIGAAALAQGLSLTDQPTAILAAQRGVTIDSARKAFTDIAARLGTDKSISGRFGDSFGQPQEEQATLLGDSKALNQQHLLYSEEKAQFSGNGGANADTAGNPGADY
jgi:hypothetical protein